MPIPTAAAANAYAALARMGEQTANLGRAAATDSVGAELQRHSQGRDQRRLEVAQKSDMQSQAVANGNANMVDVVTAVAETETTVQTLVSVRDKVIAAYEDILKMPI